MAEGLLPAPSRGVSRTGTSSGRLFGIVGLRLNGILFLVFQVCAAEAEGGRRYGLARNFRQKLVGRMLLTQCRIQQRHHVRMAQSFGEDPDVAVGRYFI